LRATLGLRIVCATPSSASTLDDVLAPDNEGAPKTLKIGSARKSNRLDFTISSASTSTALSTAMAILRDSAMFEEVWLLTRPRHGRQPRAR